MLPRNSILVAVFCCFVLFIIFERSLSSSLAGGWYPNNHHTVLWFPSWVLSFWFFSLKFPFTRTACGIEAGGQCNNTRKVLMWQLQSEVVAASAGLGSLAKGQCSAQEHSISVADGPVVTDSISEGVTHTCCVAPTSKDLSEESISLAWLQVSRGSPLFLNSWISLS